MNKRLQHIISWISPESRGVIDVGTDHGYLPAELLKRGYRGRVVASDVNALPLQKARETAAEAGLEHKIVFLLCDGLTLCPKEQIDTIVIAGMSGETICHILDSAEWCMSERYTLLLQPMSHQEILRYWLINNGFLLEKEALVEDNGRVYQLCQARFVDRNSHLSDAELFLGSDVHLRDDPLYRLVLDRQIRLFGESLRGLCRSECRKSSYLFKKEIYQEMKTLREELYGYSI